MKQDRICAGVDCAALIYQKPGRGRPRIYCDSCKQNKSRPLPPQQPEQPTPAGDVVDEYVEALVIGPEL